MLQPIGKAIEKRIKEFGFKNKLLLVEISEVCMKLLKEVLNENDPGFARVVSFKKGILIVRMMNLAARQKACSEKERIVNSLNKTIGEKIIKKVVFRG